VPALVETSKAPVGELLGHPAPDWAAAAWANSEPLTLDSLRGRVVVVRFWTNTCPFCRASMPALQALSEELADRPVTFVGMYHAKPRDRVGAWGDAQALATEWGVTFPLAHDAGWTTLRSWWLRDEQRRATSASFVIDPEGRIVHIHPGPVLFPSTDPEHAQENADYLALKEAILAALPKGPDDQRE
jgi:thiol-disulfide isomerase/thioredoxin